MEPREILQSTGAELLLLKKKLIGCEVTGTDAAAALESMAAKVTSISREDLLPLEHQEIYRLLANIRATTKRVGTLLEAATAFHLNSIFETPAAAGTYAADGTLRQHEQDSRIVFEG